MNTRAKPQTQQSVTLRVGPQGRVVIPARLRGELALQEGETLVARIDGDALVLERPAQILKRLQDLIAPLRGDTSPVDELIAERRAEAAREDAETPL